MPVPFVIHVSKHGSIRWVSQSLLDELNLPPGALREKQIENTQAVLPKRYFRTVLRILDQIAGDDTLSDAFWSEAGDSSKMLVRWLRSGDDIEIHFFPQTGLVRRQRILERFVSPEILRMSESKLDQMRLPERRILTVSFTDLRGFTALSESLEPEESRDLLNTYLETIMDRVWQHKGWIDKLIGDEVMALYGADTFTRPHAFNAVRSACSQIKRMDQIREDCKKRGRPMLPCGIGIHSGNMLIGNIGSESYQEFTVIGSVVNLTSRIANVAGPGQILLTEETLDAFLDALPPDWECREIIKRGGSGHGLEDKRRQFVDELLPLSPDQEGKAIAVGPNVLTEQERAIYHFTYRCRVVVKGIIRPIPLIEARQLQTDPLSNEYELP
ncbi:MAG: adenylate/guanylate cyclase domain-containing protein [Opitutales bacterium]